MSQIFYYCSFTTGSSPVLQINIVSEASRKKERKKVNNSILYIYLYMSYMQIARSQYFVSTSILFRDGSLELSSLVRNRPLLCPVHIPSDISTQLYNGTRQHTVMDLSRSLPSIVGFFKLLWLFPSFSYARKIRSIRVDCVVALHHRFRTNSSSYIYRGCARLEYLGKTWA